jgi:hypothetical protein
MLNVETLHKIRGPIESISYHLRHREPTSFATPEEYEAWRSRAEFALLKYREQEREILAQVQPLVVRDLVRLVRDHIPAAELTPEQREIVASAAQWAGALEKVIGEPEIGELKPEPAPVAA